MPPLSWEEYAQQHGLEQFNVSRPSDEEKAAFHEKDFGQGVDPEVAHRKAFRKQQGLKNEWLRDYVEGGKGGFYSPEEFGLFNQPDQGKSNYSSWQQQWQQALGRDSDAQMFASSPDFNEWVRIYKDPFIAYQHWQGVRDLSTKKTGPGGHIYSHWDWDPSRGGFSTGGSNPQVYNKFGRFMSGSGAAPGSPGAAPIAPTMNYWNPGGGGPAMGPPGAGSPMGGPGFWNPGQKLGFGGGPGFPQQQQRQPQQPGGRMEQANQGFKQSGNSQGRRGAGVGY